MSNRPKNYWRNIAWAAAGVVSTSLAYALYISKKENRSFKSSVIETTYLPLLDVKAKLSKRPYFNNDYLNMSSDQVEVPRAWQEEFHLMHSHRYTKPTYMIQGTSFDISKVIIYIFGSPTRASMTYAHWQFLDNFSSYTDSLIYIPQLSSPLTSDAQTIYDELLTYYQSVLETYDAKDIILLGDSLGATIAFGFLSYLKKENLPQPMHVAMISPILDAELTNSKISTYQPFDSVLSSDNLKSIMKKFAGDLAIDSPLISPIHTDLTNLPGLSIIIGGDEILIPDARLFVHQSNQQRHRLSYQELANMFHSFQLFELPETYAVYDALATFIEAEIANQNQDN